MDDDKDNRRKGTGRDRKGGYRSSGEGPGKGRGKPDAGKKPGRTGDRPASRGEDGGQGWRKSGEEGRKPYKPRRPAGTEGDDSAARRYGRDESGDRKPFRAGKPYRERNEDAGGERSFRPRRESGDRNEGRAGHRDERAPRRDFKGDRDEGPRKDFRRRDEQEEQKGERPRGSGKPAFGEKRGFRDRAGGRQERGARTAGSADVRRDPSASEEGERIAKRLARAGVASRRDAEALIEAGRVSLNGQVLTSPAINVTASDAITIDGEPIPAIERTRLFLFHKPAGLVTTNRDPEGRKTVFDILPAELPRLMTVGRLDINTEGLLLLTNDGGLARVLELPATGWLRRYRARVHGSVDEARLAELKDGIAVDGVFYGSVEATLDREQGSNAWLTLGLREGKNREVKNILAALGLEVTRLIRVSYGPFQLGELPEGSVQELKGRMLRDQLGERLIEEAGANFDAPIVKPFSNKPTVGPSGRGEERTERQRGGLQEPGEGGLIKNRKRDREHRREDALGRLQTSKPAFRDKKREGKGGRQGEEKKFEPPRGRASNVWMAPGARPQGKKKAVEEEGPAREERRQGRGPARRDDAKPSGGGRGEGGRFRSDRPKGGGQGAGPGRPRKPRGDA